MCRVAAVTHVPRRPIATPTAATAGRGASALGPPSPEMRDGPARRLQLRQAKGREVCRSTRGIPTLCFPHKLSRKVRSRNLVARKSGICHAATPIDYTCMHSSHSTMVIPCTPGQMAPSLAPSRRVIRALAMLAFLPNACAYNVCSLPRFAPRRCASSVMMAEKPLSLSQVIVKHLSRQALRRYSRP
jgi:hypothetical protein